MPRAARHDEAGSILVIAIVLIAVMLSVGLSTFAFVDGQQQRAVEQRQRETALNLAEGVLYAQGFALARSWPGNETEGATVPTTCTSATIQSLCPDPRTLAAADSTTPASANFTNADASANVTWTTRIRDNGGPLADAFDTTQMNTIQGTCPGPCKWDANGDRKLWVQAQATVRGRPRNLVALLKREEFAESFGVGNAVTAPGFETTNSGNKTIIDVTGSQTVVRCAPIGPGCTDYDLLKGQVRPTPISIPNTPQAMTAVQLERFKAAAQSANPSTYYTSCPETYTGRVVFVDLPAATDCSDENRETYNSAQQPGVLIMARGTLAMKSTYYGLVYMVNGPGSEAHLSGPILTIAANGEVIGGIAIDGTTGRLVVGQSSHSRASISFDPNAFSSLVSFGTTGLVQNTWRELTPISDSA